MHFVSGMTCVDLPAQKLGLLRLPAKVRKGRHLHLLATVSKPVVSCFIRVPDPGAATASQSVYKITQYSSEPIRMTLCCRHAGTWRAARV